MAEKTEAQRLADLLEETPDSDGHCRQAAAELRRLEAVNAQMLEALEYCRQKLEYAQTNREWYSPGRAIDMADAAIAAAKEQP